MSNIRPFFYRLVGWKLKQEYPKDIQKAVVVMGPHTSNWDFILGRIGFGGYGINGKFLIKKQLFFFPLGFILRKLGGIPVDRSKNNNLTDIAVNLFNDNERIFMVFTPEGTRSYNDNWKKGFYYIALKAKVPILIGYMDYSIKEGGFEGIFHPTGNVDEDIKEIKRRLSKYKGKYPEKGIKNPDLT